MAGSGRAPNSRRVPMLRRLIGGRRHRAVDPTGEDAAATLVRQVAEATGGEVRAGEYTTGDDPQLRRQLAKMVGQTLDEVGFNLGRLRLSIWRGRGWNIVIEVDRFGITEPGRETRYVTWRSDLVDTATALLGALYREFTAVEVDDGHQRLAFDTGLRLDIPPMELYESWQITDDDDELLIVCLPSGGLCVWYPS